MLTNGLCKGYACLKVGRTQFTLMQPEDYLGMGGG